MSHRAARSAADRRPAYRPWLRPADRGHDRACPSVNLPACSTKPCIPLSGEAAEGSARSPTERTAAPDRPEACRHRTGRTGQANPRPSCAQPGTMRFRNTLGESRFPRCRRVKRAPAFVSRFRPASHVRPRKARRTFRRRTRRQGGRVLLDRARGGPSHAHPSAIPDHSRCPAHLRGCHHRVQTRVRSPACGGHPAICPMTHDPPGSFSGM